MIKLLKLFVLVLLLHNTLSAENKSRTNQVQNNTPSHPVEFRQQPFDILNYDADIDLTAAPARNMKGKCKITLVITGLKDTSDFIFNLRGLNIDSVFYYGTKVSPIAVHTTDSAEYHYKFPLSTTAIPKEKIYSADTADVVIYYSGLMTTAMDGNNADWGGVQSRSNILYSMGVGFMNNYISATQHWLPCYDHPSDKATFTGRFRVRGSKSCASIGLLQGVNKLGGDTTEYVWKHDFPCATYLFTFAVADYKLIQYDSSEIPYYLFTLAKDSARTANNFKLLPSMVSAFGKRFGKYPFDKVGYANTPTGSMEHQTMICYDAGLLKNNDTINRIAAHELGHQWFGDYVSCYDFRDTWLSEGFASFTESIWFEELYGFDRYLTHQNNFVNFYIESAPLIEGIFKMYDYPRESPSSNYPRTIYDKGAAVIGMLRYMLGDENFFMGVLNYLQNHKYGNVTTEILQSELENVSGIDLGDFFNQWVYGLGFPSINIDVDRSSKGNGLNTVNIKITQVQESAYGVYTSLPVEIGFKKKDNSFIYKMLTLDSKVQSFDLDSIPDFIQMTVNEGPSVRTLLVVKELNISGIEDTKQDIAVKLYPNPATGRLNVETGNSLADISFRIVDIFGNTVYSGILQSAENQKYIIDTGSFNPGVYYLLTSGTGTMQVCPFTIIR